MPRRKREAEEDGDEDPQAARAFAEWARHYYQCRRDFQSPTPFSPVPYFLLCRAIELQLKAIHLRRKSEEAVKEKFGHSLVRAYDALNAADRTLDSAGLRLLEAADAIYSRKGFEYYSEENALAPSRRFPDLAALDALARRILGLPPEESPGEADSNAKG